MYTTVIGFVPLSKPETTGANHRTVEVEPASVCGDTLQAEAESSHTFCGLVDSKREDVAMPKAVPVNEGGVDGIVLRSDVKYLTGTRYWSQ